MVLAERAVFLQLKAVASIHLVLGGLVIAPLALLTRERDSRTLIAFSHSTTPSDMSQTYEQVVGTASNYTVTSGS